MRHNLPMPAPSRTQRRIDGARQRIVDVTWELLADRPWAEVTVADICERADVAPRTFHRYFPDKVELLFADSADHERQLHETLATQAIDPSDPEPALRAALAEMARLLEPYGAEQLRWRQHTLDSADDLRSRDLLKQHRLEAVVAEALRDAGLDPLRARVWAGCALVAAQGALAAWAENGGDLGQYMQSTADLVWPPDRTTGGGR